MELTLRSEGEQGGWRPGYLELAAKEARGFLTDVQYEYAVEQCVALCEEDDPSHPQLADVDAVYDFFELRLKGGVLGRINLRVYFYLVMDLRLVVVLGAWKKESENQIPVRIVKRIQSRMRYAEESVGSLRQRITGTSGSPSKG